MIGVPFSRAINPISKTNWEGTGVEPDFKVTAAEALEVAKKLAEKKIEHVSEALLAVGTCIRRQNDSE